MTKLTDSEWDAYRALLAKFGRSESDFNVNEDDLRIVSDGSLQGFLWIIQRTTDRRMVYDLGRYRSSWLEAFEHALQSGIFPR